MGPVSRCLAVPSLLACWIAPTPAQDLAWDLPEVSAAAYRIDRASFDVDIPERTDGARFELVRASGAQGGAAWRYRQWNAGDAPAGQPTGWTQVGFDDSAWPLGHGPFSSTASAGDGTPWNTRHIGIRATLDTGRRRPKAVLLAVRHDDGADVHLNGVPVATLARTGNPAYVVLAGDGLDAWERGPNLLALHCENTGGPGALDVEVVQFVRLPAGVSGGQALVDWWKQRSADAAAMRRSAFGGFRCPPLLFDGELDGDRQRVERAPVDLRDLGWWVATDLDGGPRGGSYQRELSRIVRFGDIQVRGRARPIDTAGWQELELDVRAVPPAAGTSPDGHMRSQVFPHCGLGLSGELRVRRQWLEDAARGVARIVAFEVEFRGTLSKSKDPQAVAFPFVQRERWVLDGIRERDGAFRTAVAQAIRKGTEFLKAKLENPDHRDIGPSTAGNRSYPSGRLAIALLALIKGDAARDDAVVVKAMDALRARELVDTYSLGNALMALEAWYAPSGEFQDIMSGAIDRPRRREVPDEDRALMARWADQILANRDTRVDPAYLLRFNYVGGGRYDHSVNQYGLLGLYSAHLCGVPLSPQVWEAAANHLLEDQCRPEPRLGLRLAGEPRAGSGTVAGAVPSAPAGWHYYGPGNDGNPSAPCGSMTSAGLTGLIICEAALRDYDLSRQRLAARLERARNDGFAWFARHMQVRCNPGWVGRQNRWIYYYLYGLERSCVLAAVRTINDRDWYFEGASLLIALQNADGSWPAEANGDDAIERAAMAVLFLKKASVPVISGR